MEIDGIFSLIQSQICWHNDRCSSSYPCNQYKLDNFLTLEGCADHQTRLENESLELLDWRLYSGHYLLLSGTRTQFQHLEWSEMLSGPESPFLCHSFIGGISTTVNFQVSVFLLPLLSNWTPFLSVPWSFSWVSSDMILNLTSSTFFKCQRREKASVSKLGYEVEGTVI